MKYLPAVLAATLLSSSAFATYECAVKVTNVLMYRNGSVFVTHSGRGDYTQICNINGDLQGASGSVCVMWTTMLQAIQRKNGTAYFYYDDTGSCATMPTYGAAPVPFYIGDVTP